MYAAYSDPYIGTGGGMAQPPSYDYTPYTDYAQQQYAMDTPPGGVWVPQQRTTDEYGRPYPAEEQQQQPETQQGYPYPSQGTGEYEQYRY